MNTTVLRRTAAAHKARLRKVVAELALGVPLSVALALGALAISTQFGGPAMLYALVLGFLARTLVYTDRLDAGVDFSATTLLRLGVGLLGANITFAQIYALGPQVVGLTILGVVSTIGLGLAFAHFLGLGRNLGLLLGGAVAICGASAALAIASVLPRSPRSDANTLLAVVGVTALSTVAMVLYPLLAISLAMSEQAAGIFIGASIHDVAQVVGAGYMISDFSGETATVVKLFRIACLVPTVVAISLWTRAPGDRENAQKRPILPWFLVLFIVLSAIASFQILPMPIAQSIRSSATFLLLTAIAALGFKTSLKALNGVGLKPILVLVLATAGLAILVVSTLSLFPEYFA